MSVRKKHHRINWEVVKDRYDLNDLITGMTIIWGTTNATIREHCLSRSGAPNLDDILARGRARESTTQHDKEMIGNTDTVGPEIGIKSELAFAIKSRYGKYSSRGMSSKELREPGLNPITNANFVVVIGHMPRDK